MPAQPGQVLSHYRLTEKIGEGGMGVVWKARDTTLDRDVAIKVLPDAFAEDQKRLARFQREAKTLAALNHPNIAAIHGLEESDGLRFLVMELVPGESLAQRLARGPIPLEELLELCRQIAEALEAAHERGIIHRDLKPGNIKITPEGKVKVLDFGLAKALVTEPASGDPSVSPTMTSTGTHDGMIVGTAAYMSPEQARGKAVDKKTDIWAFGCVLFEMLTARRPFEGETVTDILARVLQSDPNWELLPASTPWRIRNLAVRCLQKEVGKRLHDIADARIEIDEAVGEVPLPTSETPVPGGGGGRKSISLRTALALAVGAALIGGGLAVAIVQDAARKQAVVPRSPQPVVFLMDTLAPSGVYDPETRRNSGTNADDLSDLLRDLPVVLHKETLGSDWHREDQILTQVPDLILVHRSAFYRSLDAEIGIGLPPFESPEAEAQATSVYELTDSKLMAFFGYVGLGDPHTKFLVYSRGLGGQWPEEEQAAWVREAEARFPHLKGRVSTMKVPGDRETATFRDEATARMIRQHVVSILGLDEPDPKWR
jgi:serine/threonine protein kinase